MFLIKKKYYFIIQSIRDINLKNIKNHNKYCIIYRNNNIESLDKIRKFRNICKNKRIQFFIANNIKLMSTLKADGLYISAYNKKLNTAYLNKLNYKIIGAAHNIKEINLKNKQGCSQILFSRLFKTSYKNKKGYLGVTRFNLLNVSRKENLVPLGGINLSNLNRLGIIKSNAFAVSSLIKEKQVEALKRFF